MQITDMLLTPNRYLRLSDKLENVEQWKDIKGYEGHYQVSNFGRIKSLERTYIGKGGGIHLLHEKILKPDIQWNGRLQVRLSKRGQHKAFKVHRLVAKAFIPNPEDKAEVNHIDGNPQNNNVKNLEWTTRSENTIHAIKNNLSKAKDNLKYAVKKNKKPLIAINLQTGKKQYYFSIKECAEKLCLNDSEIIATAKGRRKTYKNYSFKYANMEVI